MRSPLNLLTSDPRAFVAFVIAIVIAITVHEFSHAAAATAQGDLTAKAAGRLTLNPLAHLDPLGSLMLVLAGFGWGKPTPFTPSRLRSRRFGSALVGLAGPASNFLLAILAGALIRTGLRQGWDPFGLPMLLLSSTLTLNVVLGVFNLLPLPPLDGSRLLGIFLPPSRQGIVFFLDRYGVFILLGLLLFAPQLLTPILDRVQGWVFGLTGFVS